MKSMGEYEAERLDYEEAAEMGAKDERQQWVEALRRLGAPLDPPESAEELGAWLSEFTKAADEIVSETARRSEHERIAAALDDLSQDAYREGDVREQALFAALARRIRTL